LWRAWIEWRMAVDGVTDLIVFGDSVIYSAEALAAARNLGVRTWVLENGYNRPDWITLEPTGVNARSCMPRSARSYDHIDASRPMPEEPHLGAIMPFHVLNITAYFTGVVLGSLSFPTYSYPYAVPLWPQIFGHVRRFAVAAVRRDARRNVARKIMADQRPYFLACLQRDGDSQLLEHSEVKTNHAFLSKLIGSFAKYADQDTRLVVKNHPLDPGVDDLAAACRLSATAHGVADRVSFLEEGLFAPLAKGAIGVIAVNSTAAYAAIGFRKPVKLLGRAVFDIDGLVNRQSLDDFWGNPIEPDMSLFARYRRGLTSRTQIYGSFHNPRHLDQTAWRVTQRIITLETELWRQPARDAQGLRGTGETSGGTSVATRPHLQNLQR
jgi:capsular polysaccharide export protein